MNRLSLEKRVQIIGMMVEGVSIRAISRMTGASKNTIVKLLVEAGATFSDYQSETLKNLSSNRIQLNAIWSFVYAKAKNVACAVAPPEAAGDVWTWTAIDANTKLIVSWLVGDRNGETACRFVEDIAERLKHRVQINSDGHRVYLQPVGEMFGSDIDYEMLEKIYSPPRQLFCGTIARKIAGLSDPANLSRNFAERQDLSMRMSTSRFTRLSNDFTKKIENHIFAISIYSMHYNFCRIHQILRVTPAMEAGVANHVWGLEELAGLLESN